MQCLPILRSGSQGLEAAGSFEHFSQFVGLFTDRDDPVAFDEMAFHPVADGVPFVLLADLVVNPTHGILGQTVHQGLIKQGDEPQPLPVVESVADPQLHRPEALVDPYIPPDILGALDRTGSIELLHQAAILPIAAEIFRDSRPGKALEDFAPIGLETRVLTEMERGVGRKGQKDRQVSDTGIVGPQGGLFIGHRHVNVQPADEEVFEDDLQLFGEGGVAGILEAFVVLLALERVGGQSRQADPLFLTDAGEGVQGVHHEIRRFIGAATDGGNDLYHRLEQFLMDVGA